MSLDTRARAAVDELRRTSYAGAARPGIASMEQRVDARRRGRRTALAVSSLVVVAAAAGFAGGRLEAAGPVQPAGGPTATPTATPTPAPTAICTGGAVTCLGGRTYRVALTVPVTLTLPASFQPQLLDTSSNLEVYSGDEAGVTILGDAEPVKPDGSAETSVRAGAKAATSWLAARPFVQRAAWRAVQVGGLRGYRLEVGFVPGSALPGSKGTGRAALTFESSGWTAAVSPELRDSTYWLLDGPDGRLVVIWSWAVDGSGGDRVDHPRLVESLRFG